MLEGLHWPRQRHRTLANDKFLFDQIQATIEGSIQDANRRVFELLDCHPELLATVPQMRQLRKHLRIWLNKYDRIFVRTEQMCLVFAGVEEGVPFPSEIDEQVASWIDRNS